MMAKGFKPVGWVAAVAGAALGCYMLSLNVAAERAELAQVEYQIVSAKQDIRTLQTELGTRGRLAQLDRWNAEVLALSAPTSAQYLKDEFTLARFDQSEKTIDERAKVTLASAETKVKPKLAPKLDAKPKSKVAPADYAAAGAEAAAEPKAVVMRASYSQPDAKPTVKKASLIDGKMAQAIGRAAQEEKKNEKGTGGQ